MTLAVLSNSWALMLAMLLATSNPAEKLPKRDPFFTPTAAKATAQMPRVIIRNMRQDRDGNIWFATFGGPIRYDGKEFRNFGEEVGLPNTRIFSLLVARSGAIWFGSITGGDSRYDGKSFTKFTDKDGLGSNDVMWIFEDRDANIWFGTGNGVSRYDGKAMTNFTTKDGLVHNSVYAIAQDTSGRMWFGTQGGICFYDGKAFVNFADQVGRSFVNVRAIAVDVLGNIWFGGEQGAFRYDGKKLTTFTPKEGLLDAFVGSMIIDRGGHVWLGHPGGFPGGQGGGASRYNGESFQHYTQKDGLGSKTVYGLLEDKAGHIWFGSADAGACRYDGTPFTYFSATDNKPSLAKGTTVSELGTKIGSVFLDKKNNYWFGSVGQGVYRYDGKTITNFRMIDGLPDNHVGGFQEDKSGNIYIDTGRGISKFDGKTFTTLKTPAAKSPMTEWKLQPNDLWFGGGQNSGVVYRYDGQTMYALAFPTTDRGDDHYRRIPRDKFPNAKYSPYDVYTIYRDRRGHLWFGTADLGAVRFDGKSFDWLYEDHLTNVPEGGSFGIRSIIEDKDGKFWFCNTRYRYNVEPSNSNHSGTGDAVYKREQGMGDFKDRTGEPYLWFPAVIADKQGDLWLASTGGAWHYDGKTLTPYPIVTDAKGIFLTAICQDNRGDLWLCTHPAGVYKFNGKTFEKFKL